MPNIHQRLFKPLQTPKLCANWASIWNTLLHTDWGSPFRSKLKELPQSSLLLGASGLIPMRGLEHSSPPDSQDEKDMVDDCDIISDINT